MGNEHHVANVSVAESEKSTELKEVVSTECARRDPKGISPKEERLSQHEFAEDLSYGPFVYREDIVKCNKTGILGIVQEVAGDVDSDTDFDDDGADNDDEEEEVDESAEDDDCAGSRESIDCDINDTDHSGHNGSPDDENDTLKDGQIRVIWLDNSETTNSLSEITVVDRGFLHGDIVSAASDPVGQMGVVMDVNIAVDLRSTDGSSIKDIPSKMLQRVREFTMGDYVIHGHWLGRVDGVVDNVTVLFDDGSSCKVLKTNPAQLQPLTKTILDPNFPYHPGQRVKASSLSVFKNSRWLSGTWKASRMEGTVVKVQAASVFVYWIASANPGYGSDSAGVPPEEQKPKDLTLLSCFMHANWQLGDWCLLPSHPNDASLKSMDLTSVRRDSGKEVMASEDKIVTEHHSLSQSDSEQLIPSSKSDENVKIKTVEKRPSLVSELAHDSGNYHVKKICKVAIRKDKKRRRKGENFPKAFQIVNTRTKVDVVWQDGNRELAIDSKTLVPNESPGDQEFFPGQYVVEKASDIGEDAAELKRVGVVKTVYAKDRTACVWWLKPVTWPDDPREFGGEELVSVYELEEHPDYDYCYGDVVVRLSPVMSTSEVHSENPVESQAQEPAAENTCGNEVNEKQYENSEEPCKDENDTISPALSWVGNITNLVDGDIEVTWADGMVSKVGPQAIYVVGREDDDGNEFPDNDAASWQTIEDSEDACEEEKKEASSQNTSDNKTEMETQGIVPPEENNASRSGPLSIPLAALGFVTKLASGLFLRGKNDSVSVPMSDSSSKHVNESENSESERAVAANQLQFEESNSFEDQIALPTPETKEEFGCASGLTVSEENIGNNLDNLAICEGDSNDFKHFDITREPWDHYFFGDGHENTNGGKKRVKKIQQDWGILEKNLPNEIYVRVYEDRMDLLRAVIVGTYSTPYQDGLFFFDFQLPAEYPQVPPSAYYHSHGLRINPNLYEDGKVCLSLLNTWNGKGNEVWDPASSSILQVLVSLQGLVLNSKPYFNEAGYDKQVGTAEGDKNSLTYNENTFLLNCKTMLYVLRRPPKHFEEFVKHHFQKRGRYILKACNEYMKGCLVGSLTEDACRSNNSGEDASSAGFKLMLGKTLPRLISAFSEIGVDCREFEHLPQS